jgi:hypothetical protein
MSPYRGEGARSGVVVVMGGGHGGRAVVVIGGCGHGDVRKWGVGLGWCRTSSLSGEGDRCAIVVVGGDTEGAGVSKVATGWVVFRGDVVAH